MGEVYKARDTNLKRAVAVKVLPASVAADVDRLARFQREAEVLAALNHPNIAAIYDLERSGATTALVMELVEGPTLTDRIAQGPVPIEEALSIAKKIAEALEAAHEQGIIHRDLKPANIKVRSDGTVKVLDFGLAKAIDPPASSPNMSQSPTMATPAMTAASMILGTAAYMSPEQARGKPVDKRSDIWAFGCVLYEMLSGLPAFDGQTVTDVLAAIVAREADFERLPGQTPSGVRQLLHRCLQKEPKQRLRDIGDARLEIDTCLGSRHLRLATNQVPAVRWLRVLPWALAGTGVLLALASFGFSFRSTSAPITRMVQVEALIGADVSLVGPSGPATILSPDGSLLAFVGRRSGEAQQLYVRRLDQLQATALAGTADARGPFFAPDGQWIAFFAGGKLKKVPVAGGTVVIICDAPDGRGGTWSEDNSIIFNPSQAGGISLPRVSAAGGAPQPLTTLADGEVTHRWPQVLPGGHAVLYTTSKNLGSYNDGSIVAQPLPNGTRKILIQGGYFGRFMPSGHLTYIHDGRLFAVPIDINKLELGGSPVPILEHVSSSTTRGFAQFDVSSTGTAVYLPGGVAELSRPIQWLTSDGTTAPLRAMPSDWSNLRLSPDGLRVAVDIYDGKQTDVWLYEWTRDALTPLTFDQAEDWMPVWTPDAQRVVFRSARDLAFNLYWQRADGTGTAERLTRSANPQVPSSWHPSGKVLALVETNPATSTDIMLLSVEGDGPTGVLRTPTAFLNTPAAEAAPAFSPDGQWIAYTSNESGREGVYVRPYPGPGGQWLIAPEGSEPTWSRTRRELFYLRSDQRLMVSPYNVEGHSFRAETPRVWSASRLASRSRGLIGDGRAFDLHPDGKRIAGVWAPESQAELQNSVVVVFNIFDELRRMAQTTR
jgi:serine/threonine-protein kinase